MTPSHRLHAAARSLLVFALLSVAHAAALAQVNSYVCGEIRGRGQFGPFDYRTLPSDTRHLVEDYHFTPAVEQLTGGGTSSIPGPDLDYTLRAFPNSPRALLSASRLANKTKMEQPKGMRYRVECYFERAIRFVPDDPMPHVLYAGYLKDRKRAGEARSQLDQAESLRGEPTNFDFDYNLGLLYFEVGAYDNAMAAARRAYALGAPLPALEKKLRAIGKWSE